MSTLYLIVEVRGNRVAIPALAIDSVVEGVAIAPVPLAERHVAGLAALRSRVLTMIDVAAAAGLEGTPIDSPRPTVIVAIDGQLYGLLVDAVDDVVEMERDAEPLRGAIESGWAAVSRGMITVDGSLALVVDPAALIASPDSMAA